MDGCQVGKDEKRMASVKIELENLACKSSYEELKKNLLSVKGIVDVDIDKTMQAAFIDFENDKITQQQILDKISML